MSEKTSALKIVGIIFYILGGNKVRKIIKRIKNEKGLTLVELLAVVVILAIVAAIAFVMIGNVMENSRKDAAVADALQVINAAKLYETAGEGTLPVDIKDLQGEDGYLETLYDPWTKKKYAPEDSSSDGVAKTEEGYEVELTFSECNIEASEDELIEKGRDACDNED